ncbi:MAG: preprotein translocase subunit SecE [Deltaproteobacteria bacterium]|nr:preprotein translocase subunit SecE [Deltaproteobacteria bacterium]
MGNNKWVHLMFALGGLLLAYLMVQATGWIWGYFAKPPDLYVTIIGIGLGGVIAFLMWRNPNLFTKASEIINELTKVTWPTRKETSAATVVVIITTVIISMILGLFDLVWSWATGIIYS